MTKHVQKTNPMILATAQTSPKKGDINSNLQDHYKFIKIAANNNANLILFPEMSITGYEREDANTLALTTNDNRLEELRKLAVLHQIIIIAGAPIKIEDDLFIGSFIFTLDGLISVYTKQFLHTGEEVYFSSSFENNPIIQLKNERISLAICADIDNPKHPENAKKEETSIYLASIFFTPNSITDAHLTLKNYAKKHNMNILMSNFCGQSWETQSGGRSAFWDNNGNLISEMDDSNSGIMFIEKEKNKWKKLIVN